jgi:hypothetical protein
VRALPEEGAGAVAVAEVVVLPGLVGCGDRWPGQACSSNSVMGSLALQSWLAIVERTRWMVMFPHQPPVNSASQPMHVI